MAGSIVAGLISPSLSEPPSAGDDGLSDREATERLLRFGPNEVPRRREPSLVRRVAHQAAEPLSLVLLAAAVVSAVVLDQPLEGTAIAAIVALNVAIGTFEERRAAVAVAALEALTAPTARVRRAGATRTVPAADLVPGDVVEVAAGDRVPADLVLDDASLLAADEAIITGEAFPAHKTVTGHQAAEGVAIGDRPGELFAGTSIVRGRGVGTVVATGPATVLGAVAVSLGVDLAPPPLVGELRRVAGRMSVAAVILGALAVPVVFARAQDEDRPLVVAVLAGVALAVAAIPEGLATVVVGALAIGARRMADHGAIVRRLPAIEALGSADIICTDKTGTITTGQLAVERAIAAPGCEYDLWLAVVRCNDSHDGQGDPIDVVLARAAAERGVGPSPERRIAEEPFDTETRRMVVVHQTGSGPVLSLKGAPEVVFERCAPGPAVDALAAEVGPLAAEGMRVLAVAGGRTGELDASGLDPLGIVAFHDPLRATAVDAIERCRQAGIRVVLVTGDHVDTAMSIAAQAGIVGPVVSGDDLRGLDGNERRQALRDAAVVARVDPATKLDLVQAHQSTGRIVAMTGDGVNDAPALQAADVGVAIAGEGGTDVARAAADIVVTNGDLGTIVTAVAEGRRILGNIRAVVSYLVTGNIGEVLVVAAIVALLPDLSVPLLPVQLLWINLVTDGLPALALGVDRPPGDPLRPTARTRHGLLDLRTLSVLGSRSLLVAGIVVTVGIVARSRGWEAGVVRTQILLALLAVHLLLAYTVRAQRTTFEPGWWRNRVLNVAIAASLLLQVLAFATPAGRDVLRLSALPIEAWPIAVLAAAVTVAAIDGLRIATARGPDVRTPPGPTAL